ncbi:MAG: TonB-dependent receptor [Blastocatellia bacterium]|nr:TonB-dependent receptor [Blastocatellia bacterium]
MQRRSYLIALAVLLLGSFTVMGRAQTTGGIKGKVTLESQNVPVHNVIVILTQLKMTAQTDEQGNFEFKEIPEGVYSLVARLDRVPDVVRQVEVKRGQTVTIDVQLKLSGVREQVTISAAGHEQTASEAFQGVTGIDATTLLENPPTSLGDALERQTGITKRSFGPGSSRPVIRGFDGDRVLIAQDGLRTGTLSYSSGDHGEPINLLSVERVEVVRGPATLLYGSSAIGGLVNAVSGHQQAHPGVHGFFSGVGSSTANLGGASAGIEFGGKNWTVWGGGGGQKSGDYGTPIGKIVNSGTKNYDFNGGAGYFGDRGFLSGSYNFNRNEYGVPVDFREEDPEVATLNPRRHNFRLNGGFNNLRGAFDHVHLTFDYTDYKHEELIGGEPETRFFNKTYSYRALAEQKRVGRFSGTIGVSGFRRDYEVIGDEALVPPTTQDSFSAFALEEIDLKRIAFQFGARVERNAYNTTASDERRNRTFTGFSGSAGLRVPLWVGGSFSANYTHSYRAPSLDELYNNGPHPGNLTFEIGNTELKRERGDGIDLSLRHSAERVRAEAHYFHYSLGDFVFLAPTGEEEDGLPVADYLQGDSRFRGTEFDLGIGLHRTLWLNTGLDYVNAELKANSLGLPRIPPLRARLGFDWQYKNVRLFPELIMARDQDRLFTSETRTPGYGIVNLLGGYTFATEHAAHIFSVNGFNLGNKLYFNHLSFIKDIAPEIGRGVRFSYTVRFF